MVSDCPVNGYGKNSIASPPPPDDPARQNRSAFKAQNPKIFCNPAMKSVVGVISSHRLRNLAGNHGGV